MDNIYEIFFSNSPRMAKLKTVIDEVAKTDIAVLIKGESGTGKDLAAQAIHLNSPRHEKPFIKVNCAAIPRGLLESELFGFEKGAFTGACLKKPGKFELANEGTILLDEISEIDISIQAKLLQVLQDGRFSRLGGSGDILVNARVITTTKDHLEKKVEEGSFREDLFFRINVISLTVPSLRDRDKQILPLSRYFFDFYKTKYRRPVSFLSGRAVKAFNEYDWPGNMRELENQIKRMVLFGEEAVLNGLGRGPWEKGTDQDGLLRVPIESSDKEEGIDLKGIGKRAAEMAERDIIQTTLQETRWNRKEAAKLLRVSYKALLYKIQRYHLDDRKGRRPTEGTRDEKVGG
jgi:two-component system, NtrC family, response regulator AtoC